MALSYEDVVAIQRDLEDDYRERHNALRRLRDYWHGRYWDRPDSDAEREGISILNVFRDLTNRGGDVGPDLKLVHNLLFEVCLKFQTYLSPLPMIRMYVDEPQSDHRRNQAALKERYLYGVWKAGNMTRQFNQIAWYLPLMGSSFFGVYPDLERNHPVPLQRSPEYAYPIPSYDGRDMDGVIFCWDAPESAVSRAYPNFTPSADYQKGRLPVVGKRRVARAAPTVKMYEYSDRNEIGCWAGTQKLKGVEHGFGFNLFKHLKFIDVPDEQFGHGAVEQIVNLVEMGNALRSLLFQSVLENVFPHLVLTNPMKAPEEIDLGVGGVIPLNEGGKAEWLTPPVQAMSTQAALIQENALAVKEGSSMPDVNFGNFRASIVTGKAINELQGAGTGSTVEMVQGCGIGDGIVEWNEQAIYIAQTMFKDDVAMLNGVRPRAISDMAPERFGLRVKGSQLVGSANNEVIFSPTLDLHTKLVMNLQALGGGLVSKQYAREQIGIPDNQAMEEEIFTETIEAAVLEGLVQGLVRAGSGEDAAAMAEAQGLALINGSAAPAPSFPSAAAGPAALLAGGGGGAAPPPPGGGGPPVGPLSPGASGSAISPALALPPGSPPPPGSEPPPHGGPPGQQAPQGSQTSTLEQVASDFASAQIDVQGRVFLVGELVQRGSTDGPIEVALTDGDDRQPIQQALQQYTFSFHVVQDEPVEQHVEVTPGAEPTRGGGNPGALDQILGGG